MLSGPVQIVVIIAAIGYVLVRRLLGEPVQAKRMLVLPAVLCLVGFAHLTEVPQTATSVVFLIVTAGAGAAIGLGRGLTVEVSERDGVAFLRYTALTVGLWVVNIAVKFGGGFLLDAIDPAAEKASSSGLMLTLGIGILVEGLVVLAKAARSGSHVDWTIRSSPVADNRSR
ncbi:DUF1453 domain-containing protein [Amycolatopsis sp. NPDC021455]|uniref:DUF1453 domain-containing protein n=1 Tax=Amycolatopsis sp. NPDC021455 TaxID=3154901 RepID=UPI0033C76579